MNSRANIVFDSTVLANLIPYESWDCLTFRPDFTHSWYECVNVWNAIFVCAQGLGLTNKRWE